MRYSKYSEAMLAEAAAASTTMAGVMRHLGLRIAGGTHAHLRRRITKLGIDTSHFNLGAHNRGKTSTRRRTADQILILRPADAKRENPIALRRALAELGHPYLCEECGVGDEWNGRPLTLQVDHINGEFWDCRRANLRYVCPNCHSQTATYAGRNRFNGLPLPAAPVSDEEKMELLSQVKSKQISIRAAARLMSCDPSTVRRLVDRLVETGSLAPRPRQTTEGIQQIVVARTNEGAHGV